MPRPRPSDPADAVEVDPMIPAAVDPRIAAFCSPEGPEVFHPVAHRHEIWREDPFDVQTIHEEARAAFRRLVHRATTPPGLPSGRILLLKGEAGSGKTHLMRAFRNWAHSGGRGYCGYMQMTSSTDHYGRYVLYNLLDSLDQPYYEADSETSGLKRLSTALAEATSDVPRERLAVLREDDLEPACLAKLIDALADQILLEDRFNDFDFEFIRALLYLQRDDPRIKSRVLKYLRCEGLSDADRRMLGGIEPRLGYADAPERVVRLLGKLMWAVGPASLILCVDQLEDIYHLDDAPLKFRRAMATVCDLAGRVPSSVVVISCLEDFYDQLRAHLTYPMIDRIEKDPNPITLKGNREAGEVVELVAYRLKHLYDTLDVPFRDDQPTFPIPSQALQELAGQRSRDVLAWCQDYRERCIAEDQVDVPLADAPGAATPPPLETTGLDQAWNDVRTSTPLDVPTEEHGLASLLAGAIAGVSDELVAGGHWFSAEADGRMIQVERHGPDNAIDQILVGLCNKAAQGGGLGKQIAKVVERAGEHTPVIARATEFPSSPKAAVSKQIGKLIARGGRRAVVGDSDWRTMLAMQRFRADHGADPGFGDWLKQERPLGRLKSLRAILDLDRPTALRPAPEDNPSPGGRTAPPIEVGTADPPAIDRGAASGPRAGPISVGVAGDRTGAPVEIEPGELRTHVAFLGGPGSGKTTVALNIVEQLLLSGIPAILVDRKGDLCGYARIGEGASPPPDPTGRLRRLRERVDVGVYTPGNPNGRPLSIAIVPEGLGELPSFEREQVARFAASALAGMMNYSGRGGDQARQVILARAIGSLGQLEPDRPMTMDGLIRYIHEADPSLVHAVGRLDTKLFGKLVQDLETLRLSRGALLTARGERLEAEALLGLGRHATPGKTRLSVISTKFLGNNQDVQFWVSQLLVEMTRWASRAPSADLQAVLLFDEADLYLPAQRQPPTKEPMENLLRRARSSGLGLLLATQSPGDFDYKCRDTIRTWFLGRVKESTALAKMKPMLSECRADVSAKLPTQETGQFHLVREGMVAGLRADPSAIVPEQWPEDAILALARRSLQSHLRVT